LYNTLNIDYDFISPDYHRDAYDLGNLIAKEFDEVSVISARHISTMRVRYLFMPVADITYVPQVLYDKIPTIPFRGMSVIHPHAQHIDQMRALRTTAENPPHETFLSSRIEKDITRFLLLYSLYPYEGKEKLSDCSVHEYSVTNGILGGRQALKHHFGITHEIPYSIYTDDVDSVVDELKGTVKSKHPQLLDKLPPTTIIDVDGVLIYLYDTRHSLHLSNGKYISAYGLATECASRAMFYDDKHSKQVLNYIMNVIAKDFSTDFKFLQGSFYGSSNESDAYLLEKRNIEAKASGTPFVSLIPRNAYPDKGGTVKKEFYEFEPSDSPVLHISGELSTQSM